jgi:hypothetical protein
MNIKLILPHQAFVKKTYGKTAILVLKQERLLLPQMMALDY